MTDLTTTWDAACQSFGRPDFLRLVGDGIASRCITDAMTDREIGADDIAIKSGRWERRFMGDRAVVIPVHAPTDGELIDLVAFRIETPRSYWSMDGRAVMLGYDSLTRAAFMGEPLMVHECPMDWLRAGRTGIVILGWEHYWPAYLAGVPALRTMTAEFGRKLHDKLAAPLSIPEIQVAA